MPMPFREHLIRLFMGMLLANCAFAVAPEPYGRLTVLVFTLAVLLWAAVDAWLIEPLRVADREEELRRYAVERDPDAPRTARGFPIAEAKSFSRVYPYGCPDPQAMA